MAGTLTEKNTSPSWKPDLTPRMQLVLAVAGLVILTVVVIAIWGSSMGFPVDFSKSVAGAVDDSIRWMTREGSVFFRTTSDIVLRFLIWIRDFLEWLPWPVWVIGIGGLGWRMAGRAIGAFSTLALLAIGFFGLWESAMETMAVIIVSVIISVAVALPVGIFAARSDRFDAVVRPILDMMQTLPSFVYLVPAIMFFGFGEVPAVFSTVVYAVPPGIRLTNLGIRQISPDIVEAAQSFGTTGRQLLFKVQIPMAVPTIMAGINQVTMMALAMVVIAALVGAGGLGEDVLRGLQRQAPGDALLPGLAIVGLAIIIDRITQAAAKERQAALSSQH